MDFFLWFIFGMPLIAAVAIYSYYDQKDEREKVNRRIQRLEEYDMKREQQPQLKEVIKVRCPSCKEVNPESAKYCNECGVTL
jgi:hypothetical protein